MDYLASFWEGVVVMVRGRGVFLVFCFFVLLCFVEIAAFIIIVVVFVITIVVVVVDGILQRGERGKTGYEEGPVGGGEAGAGVGGVDEKIERSFLSGH